jgi:AmmeMemoRadiSam system protein B/AmmeMemoRadiSam system protein A
MKLSVLKYTVLLVLLFFNCAGQQKQQNTIREPVVAGTFYPSGKTELQNELAAFFKTVENKTPDDNIRAIIVPHAGYVFSGEVAASAFAQLNPEKEYSRIFVVGTSHHIMMNGASIYNRGNYCTPLGEVEVDIELANKLLENQKLFKFNPAAHDREHSLEVQLPFLQYHLKKPFKIVPIIISTQNAETCQKIADALKPYFTNDNLFVISSDFSHYPNYANAVKTDKITADAIASNSPEIFAETINDNAEKKVPDLATSCCGWSSVLTLLYITSETPGIAIQHVKYMNSGDTKYGDKQRVVGYHSFVFTVKNNSAENNNFILSPNDKKLLLGLARETIVSRLNNKDLPKKNEAKLSEVLKTRCGAFVTLTKNDKLRGCIGRFVATEPLYKVVQDMALAAALEDRRFSPVKLNEMEEIEIEISVLTPLKPISSPDEFELGKHGIYMIKNGRSGTFLPQVAHDTQWNKEEFLGHCARDKAGIGWDGWKDAQLFTYEALVFSEKEMKITGK